MTISMFQASVPVFIRALNNLAGILAKGEAHAQARKIDAAVLLNSRLFPDMFPLVRQVQIATDTARTGAARLAGAEFPAYEDNETTFAALATRIQNTVRYLETLQPTQIDGSEDKTIPGRAAAARNRCKGSPICSTIYYRTSFFMSRRLTTFFVTTASRSERKTFWGPERCARAQDEAAYL